MGLFVLVTACSESRGSEDRTAKASAPASTSLQSEEGGDPTRRGENDAAISSKAEQQSETDEFEPSAPDQAKDRSRLLARAWWNDQELIDVVGLSAAQRTALDHLVETSLEGSDPVQARAKDAQDRAEAALLEGRFADATLHAESLAEASAELMRRQFSVRVEGLRLLDDDQRALLGEEYPHLVKRSWLRQIRRQARPSQN